MPKASPIQTSFNAGRLSKRLEGRIDLAKYANGCRVLQNFIPQIQGPAEKRPGTRYVADANPGPVAGSENSHVRLIPFQFSTDDAYILEFTNEAIRVYRNEGQVLAPPVVFEPADIDLTLDQINLGTVRHYLAHQHGPYRISVSAGGTLPPGLVGGTDYFIVNNEEGTFAFVDADVDTSPGNDWIQVTREIDFSSTRVSITSNTITFPDGHGYQSGDGPLRVTLTGGPGPIPMELAVDTDYFVIRISDTVLKLSETRRGVPVNLTDNGNGASTFTLHLDHGYSAGFHDGPVQFVTTGTLPGGINLATDYWVNRFDPSRVQLSTTREGSALNITSAAGGGIHTMIPRDPNDAFRFQLSLTFDGVSVPITGVGAFVFTLTPSAGLPFQIFSPYHGAFVPDDQPTSEIYELFFTQSADVMFLAHKDHAPMSLSRMGHDQWTLEEIFFDFPPFLDLNTNKEINLYVTSATGNMTIFAEDFTGNKLTDFFTADDVGRHIRIGGDPAIRNRLWEVSLSPDVVADEELHFDGNLYKVTNGPGATGVNPPIHTTRGQNELDRVTPTTALAWTFLHRGAAWATITGFVDGGEVAATVIQDGIDIQFAQTVVNAAAPDGITKRIESTPDHAFGAWDSLVEGYPRTVTFFEERLWWAATVRSPQTLWASQTGDFQNHEETDTDESGLRFTLNTDEVNVIEWISPGQDLAIGTAGGEFIAQGGGADEGLTPTNLRIVRHSNFGSRVAVMPLRIEQVVLFIQRSGARMRELVFDFDTDSFVAPDISVMADDLFGQSVPTDSGDSSIFDKTNSPRTLAFQQEPKRNVWIALDSGELLCMTYDRTQEVVGWHTHEIGNLGWTVMGVAVIPNPDGDADQLWIAVRTGTQPTDSIQIMFLEKPWHEDRELVDAFYVDSGLTLDESLPFSPDDVDVLVDRVLFRRKHGLSLDDGPLRFTTDNNDLPAGLLLDTDYFAIRQSDFDVGFALTPGGAQVVITDGGTGNHTLLLVAVTTITGLDHLEGLTVKVLADALVRNDEVVSSGSITIGAPGVRMAQVGLGYDSILQTMRFEAGAADGTAQGKLKRITRFVVRLFQTGLGLRYGAEDDAFLQDVPQIVAATAADLKDGDTQALSWPKGYEQAGRILLKHSTPLPCTITAIMPQITTQDR